MESVNEVIPHSGCPVCNSLPISIGNRYDDRYGYQGSFPLLKCQNCGHAFLQGEFPPELLRDLYSNYYPRSTFDLESYRPFQEHGSFKDWLDGEKSSTYRWVPRNVRVLDIGCGFGESLGYHQARGCDVYGVEADENIRRVADKFGYKVHVGLFDAGIYEPEFFDYVTMNQVIEHVTDPLSTLRGVARILKQGGTAILSTPNAGGWGAKLFGCRWINWHAPYHMQFFSRRSMQLAAERAGLVVANVKTTTHSEWLYYQWIHLATYPKPGEPSRFWSLKYDEMTRLQRRILRALAIIHRTKIDHLLTRFFDSTGLGDNYVFILKKQ